MKNIFKKTIILFLSLIMMMGIGGGSSVYAATTTTNGVKWNFQIYQVGDALRTYYNNTFTLTPSNLQKGQLSGKTYYANTKEVVIQTELYNNYTDPYIYVDDKYIGNSTYYLIDNKDTGDYHYMTFAIKNLTPGTHKISVKADEPYTLGSSVQISDYLYVNIPVYVDDQITAAIDRINNGNGTKFDYSVIGIDNLDASLDKVNAEAKGKNFDASNIQSGISDIVSKLKTQSATSASLKNINGGTAKLADYTSAGITGVTSSNLSQINILVKIERDKNSSDLDAGEVQVLINDLSNIINKTYERINLGQGTLDDYKLLSITNVDDINLSDVNAYVKGKDQSKLKTNVNSIVNALSSINKGAASVANYTTVGITGVDNNNRTAVNSVIKDAKANKGANLNKDEIQKAVDEILVKIDNLYSKIKLGTAVSADYKAIGVTNVNDINVDDVNEYLKGQDIATLQKLTIKINSVVSSLDDFNNGKATLVDCTNLNIKNIVQDNLAAINKQLKNKRDAAGHNFNKAEIQKITDDTIKEINDTYPKFKSGTAVLDDYELLAINLVDSSNLDDVNEYVKNKYTTNTIKSVKALVQNCKNYLTYINNGSATTFHYTQMDIKNVTKTNLGNANKAVRAAKAAKGSNLTKAEIQKVIDSL